MSLALEKDKAVAKVASGSRYNLDRCNVLNVITTPTRLLTMCDLMIVYIVYVCGYEQGGSKYHFEKWSISLRSQSLSL